MPKVIYANSSAEYWVSQAGLTHTTLNGRDAQIPENVRIYHFAGTQHIGFPLPLTSVNSNDGTKAIYQYNHVNYVPLMRAALVNLDRWVSTEETPAPSKHPRVSDGTAIGVDELRERFPNIPDVSLPRYLPPVGRFDFGPEMARSIATQLPPKTVAPYPSLVPGVDEDGNEVAGIRLPDVAVPLATYTGWNARHSDIGGEGYVTWGIALAYVDMGDKTSAIKKGNDAVELLEKIDDLNVSDLRHVLSHWKSVGASESP
ncbi:MAG: hypothetical protein IIC21_10415 [Chloroflexi bacterium]|nr:hypothetical protein [Chloroflexota bacterium]